MRIEHLTIRQPDGGETLHIKIGEGHDLQIRITNYGAGGYRLYVEASTHTDEGYNPTTSLADAAAQGTDLTHPDFWGQSLVWASPATIAHLVVDVLANA